MARARDRQQWNHTASLLALLATAWLRKRGRAAKPREFNPYERGRGGRGVPVTKRTLGWLAAAMGAIDPNTGAKVGA